MAVDKFVNLSSVFNHIFSLFNLLDVLKHQIQIMCCAMSSTNSVMPILNKSLHDYTWCFVRLGKILNPDLLNHSVQNMLPVSWKYVTKQPIKICYQCLENSNQTDKYHPILIFKQRKVMPKTFSSGRVRQSAPGQHFGILWQRIKFNSFISLEIWSFRTTSSWRICFWNQETGAFPYCQIHDGQSQGANFNHR